MSTSVSLRCKACLTDWIESRPADNCQMITQPDEHTWLWWRCPYCGWQAIRLDQHNIETLHSYGVKCVDWSDIEPDQHTPPTIHEYAQMLELGNKPDGHLADLMGQAAETILWEAER